VYINLYELIDIEDLPVQIIARYSVNRGPGSSVGIATELRAGRSGIECR